MKDFMMTKLEFSIDLDGTMDERIAEYYFGSEWKTGDDSGSKLSSVAMLVSDDTKAKSVVFSAPYGRYFKLDGRKSFEVGLEHAATALKNMIVLWNEGELLIETEALENFTVAGFRPEDHE